MLDALCSQIIHPYSPQLQCIYSNGNDASQATTMRPARRKIQNGWGALVNGIIMSPIILTALERHFTFFSQPTPSFRCERNLLAAFSPCVGWWQEARNYDVFGERFIGAKFTSRTTWWLLLLSHSTNEFDILWVRVSVESLHSHLIATLGLAEFAGFKPNDGNLSVMWNFGWLFGVEPRIGSARAIREGR